jgi:carbon-monoxide dehydrogenase medium subunit
VAEAASILDQFDGSKVVAGGTALTIMLRQGLIDPEGIVSLNRVPDLDRIDEADDGLHIGALVTHRRVELNPIVQRRLAVLASTFGQVANVRVRNAATVGGVMAESDYASDPPTTLLALDAEVEATGIGGRRVIPARDFFVAFYETALTADEVVTGIRVPWLPHDAGATYCKYVTRSSEDRPCVGVAAVVRLEADGHTCADLRVAVGAAAETPQRFSEAEAEAVGHDLTPEVVRSIADRYAGSIDTLDDMRGTAWYRTQMVRVWVRRAIEQAREQAAGLVRADQGDPR